MPTFRVTVEKEVVSSYTAEIEVEAETEDEAREVALEKTSSIVHDMWYELWSDEVYYSVSDVDELTDEE